MPLALVRIDDRLIHGQVAVAWGSALGADRIVLANDEVANTAWKRSLYAESDAMGTAISVVDLHGLDAVLSDALERGETVILVFGSPRDALRAIEQGLQATRVNVGGMHHAEGKAELLPYVYIDDEERRDLLAIAAKGVDLRARDVPYAEDVDLLPLVESMDG